MAWGQGLLPEQKIHSVFAQMLYQQHLVEAEVLHYAHSGATIGFENGTPTPPVTVPRWWPREIPQANPTIYEQCELAKADHPDQRFDYIILAGGINDVNVTTIFWPWTSVDEIYSRSHRYCRDAMLALLTNLRSRYVAANPYVKVIVLGYYPVLTAVSAIPNVWDVIRALIFENVDWWRRREQLMSQSVVSAGYWDAEKNLVRNSIAFRDASREDLDSAVSAANAAGSTANFLYVDPYIADNEAAFADNALLWDLLPKTEIPHDPIYDDRIQYCTYLLRNQHVEPFTCERASVGHPNIQGAVRYANKIFAAVSPPLPTLPSASGTQ